MKLARNLLKCASITGLCCATTLPIISLASCKGDVDIKEIKIWGNTKTVKPGKTLRMIYSCKPRQETQPKIKWELIDLPELVKTVKINSRGVINVPSDVVIPEGTSVSITVKASIVGKESVNDTASVTVIPEGASGFVGFEDNEIRYLDPNKEPASMQIIQKENKKYEAEKNIDLFIDDPVTTPGWHAPIDFTPIFTPDAKMDMRFYREGYEPQSSNEKEALNWMDYTDGNPTKTIPNFFCSSSTFPLSYMIVRFDDDEDVELRINFRLWQKRTQTTNGRMHYLHDSTKTVDYEMKMQGEGEYICNLRCPIKKTSEDEGIYTDTLSTIICYGGIKEFTDYDIVWDFSVEDAPIKNAFTLTQEPVERYESEFDLTPYWITGFTYTFDISKLQGTTEQLEYQSFRIFRLCLHDKWNPEERQFAAWCTFSVEWVNV